MSNPKQTVVYAGAPNPVPEERYHLRYWKTGQDAATEIHPNGWNIQADAIAQAKAFRRAGWHVQVVDTRAGE